MTFGNRLKNPYEGEGERRMYRGSVEPDYSTRRIAAVCLWDKIGVEAGSLSMPIRNLEGIETMKDIAGFVLWIEIVYAGEVGGEDGKPIGISSIERAEYTDNGIEPDYFSQ